MRYQGSKARIIKHILPVITEYLDDGTTFYDVFGGGMNVVSHVDHMRKTAVELNRYVLSLWKKIKRMELSGRPLSEYIPMSLLREEYDAIKRYVKTGSGEKAPSWLIGYVGTACSFGGGWFNGYAAYNPKKQEDHILEAFNGLDRQVREFKHIATTEFICGSYSVIKPDGKAVIYCDPPYQCTKAYKDKFNHGRFWDWARSMAEKGNKVYVSEYTAPDDFEEVWSMDRKDGMGSSTCGVAKKITEKIFVPRQKKLYI